MKTNKKEILVVTKDKANWYEIVNPESMTNKQLKDMDDIACYADLVMNVKTGHIIKNRKGPKGHILTDSNRTKILISLGLKRVQNG